MDPNEALTCLLQACDEGDTKLCAKYAEALFDWFRLGGFTPNTQQCIARYETIRDKQRNQRRQIAKKGNRK